ncbi:MAG: hypothetical protein K8T90_16890 [Planctomycetes bacterium]|nr:hypothetical protein [Planctomycetota bacterium]
MKPNITLHHRLEDELLGLRILRDMGHAEFRAEDEDRTLDAMEAAWLGMSPEERHELEIERRARYAPEFASAGRDHWASLADVDRDARMRRSIPPRIGAGAA